MSEKTAERNQARMAKWIGNPTVGNVVDGCEILAYDNVTRFALVFAKDDYLAGSGHASRPGVHYRVGRIEVYPDGRPAYFSDYVTSRYCLEENTAWHAFVMAANSPDGTLAGLFATPGAYAPRS